MSKMIPLSDPQKNVINELRAWSTGLKHPSKKICLFPEKSILENDGSWLPQDACGGYQWNARYGLWQKSKHKKFSDELFTLLTLCSMS